MKYSRFALVIMLCFCWNTAEAGISQTLLRELTKISVSASKETGENAAKQVAKAALKKLPKDVAKEGAELLSRYGDNAVLLLTKPERVELFAKYGDDAAKAIINNGDAAVNVIRKVDTPAAAKLMSQVSRSEARGLQTVLAKGSASLNIERKLTDACLKGGKTVIRTIIRHPIAAALLAYVAWNPNSLAAFIKTLIFASQNPYWALLILMLALIALSGLYFAFRRLFKRALFVPCRVAINVAKRVCIPHHHQVIK